MNDDDEMIECDSCCENVEDDRLCSECKIIRTCEDCTQYSDRGEPLCPDCFARIEEMLEINGGMQT